MKSLFKIVGAAAVSLSLSVSALSAETVLKISSWLPPTHSVNTGIFANLITMMEEATGGEVSGELVFGLAPPPAQMDLVLDGAADMAIIFHGYQPGRFVAMRFMPTTSHFDYDLTAIHAQDANVEDLTGRQLRLMRGEDISRRNNFSVGRQSSTVTTHVGRVH